VLHTTTLIKKQHKLAIKHLISVLKPTHLKELCENDMNLEYIELRKDFPDFIKHLRARAAVAELLLAPSRTGKYAKSSDKTSTAALLGASQVGITQALGRVLPNTIPLALFPRRRRFRDLVSLIDIDRPLCTKRTSFDAALSVNKREGRCGSDLTRCLARRMPRYRRR
jgi:hypothetical protein